MFPLRPPGGFRQLYIPILDVLGDLTIKQDLAKTPVGFNSVIGLTSGQMNQIFVYVHLVVAHVVTNCATRYEEMC